MMLSWSCCLTFQGWKRFVGKTWKSDVGLSRFGSEGSYVPTFYLFSGTAWVKRADFWNPKKCLICSSRFDRLVCPWTNLPLNPETATFLVFGTHWNGHTNQFISSAGGTFQTYYTTCAGPKLVHSCHTIFQFLSHMYRNFKTSLRKIHVCFTPGFHWTYCMAIWCRIRGLDPCVTGVSRESTIHEKRFYFDLLQ